MIRLARAAVTMAVPVLVAGCGPDYSPNTYSAAAVQQANKVDRGIIIGVRKIDISAAGVTGAATGGAAGGVLGGAAGSDAGGGAIGTALGAIGGGLVGGLIGTSVEHATSDTFAYEYIVRETNNELVSVTQKDAEPLKIGTKVLVIGGKQARIVPDYTVDLPPPASTGVVVSKPSSPAAPFSADEGPSTPVVSTSTLPAPTAAQPTASPAGGETKTETMAPSSSAPTVQTAPVPSAQIPVQPTSLLPSQPASGSTAPPTPMPVTAAPPSTLGVPGPAAVPASPAGSSDNTP